MLRNIVLVFFVFVSFRSLAQKADIAKSDAIIAEGQRNYQEAAMLYKKAADLYTAEGKTDTFCIFKAGQNFVRIKNYQEGVRYLEKARSQNYQDENLYLYLADGYDGLKVFDKAEEILLKGIELYPDEKAAYLKKLSYYYYKTKNFEKVIRTVDEALKFYPDNIKLLYLKGNSLLSLNKFDDAVNVFKTILYADPDNKKALSKVGVALFKKTENAYNNEVKRYKKLKNPDRIAYHDYRKKIEQINPGYQKALPYLQKARIAMPKDKLILNCLMISYIRLNMKDKANEIKMILEH